MATAYKRKRLFETYLFWTRLYHYHPAGQDWETKKAFRRKMEKAKKLYKRACYDF